MKHFASKLPLTLFFACAALPAFAVSSAGDFGQLAQATPTTRVVFVKIDDSNESQKAITVAPGETVRFVLTNASAYLHEFNIGQAASHLEHQGTMVGLFKEGALTPTGFTEKIVWHERSGMGDSNPPGYPEIIKAKHEDANATLIEPGKTKEFVWTFPELGPLGFACTLPGHYQAGEHGDFTFR